MQTEIEFEHKFFYCCKMAEQGNFPEVQKTFEKLLGEAGITKNTLFLSIINLCLSVVYRKLGKEPQANAVHEAGVQQWRSVPDLNDRLIGLNYLGILLLRSKEYNAAQYYCEQVVTLSAHIMDRQQEVIALITLANIWGSQKNYTKAIRTAENGLEKAFAIGDKQSAIRFLGNIGTYYSDQGEFAKSLEFAERTLPLSQEIGDKVGEGSQLWNQAYCLANLNRLEEAIPIAKKSLAVRESISDPRAEKVRQYLSIWEKAIAQSKKPVVNQSLIEVAIEEWNVIDFIAKAISAKFDYGYSDTVFLLNYLYCRVIPENVVNVLFDEEIFAMADSEILNHSELRISIEEYRTIWEIFVYATSGDRRAFDLNKELMSKMRSRQKEWVIALLALGIVVPNAYKIHDVSLHELIQKGYFQFWETAMGKLLMSIIDQQKGEN